MKESAQQLLRQMNLPLLEVVAPAVPGDRQRELTRTLMELLINVAEESFLVQDKEGECE